jgi:hypothetical protein
MALTLIPSYKKASKINGGFPRRQTDGKPKANKFRPDLTE